MKAHGVNVQRFLVADNAQKAGLVARELSECSLGWTDSQCHISGVPEVVLKAQILAGGRGKGMFTSGLRGGVKVTRDLDSIAEVTGQMIGHRLKTKQTHADGVLVKKVGIRLDTVLSSRSSR